MQEIRIDSEIQQCTECSSPFENLFDTCYTYRTAYLALAYQLSTSLLTVAEAAADHGGGTQSRNSIWVKGGPWDRVEKISQKADVSTLLRQMRQLCV
jgi:hypothetical protein